VFQSQPGPLLSANDNIFFAPNLGRPFVGVPFQTVNILDPGARYGDRQNWTDFRISKILRFGRARANINFDIYNIFNNDPILTENAAFAVWRQPFTVLQSRFVKIGAQLDF